VNHPPDAQSLRQSSSRADGWPERQEITDPDAVMLLSDLHALRFLTPFLRDAQTLSSAAAALERSTSTLAYWIPKFVRTGLIVHLGDERRAGMAMPRYRPPATQLVVPFRALPFDRRVALLDGGRMRVLRRFLDGLDEAVERDRAMSLGFSSDAPHSFAIEMVETSDHRVARGYTDGWMTMRLSPTTRGELSQAMEALIAKFNERRAGNRSGARRCIVHAGVAPDPRVRWRSVGDDIPK
jgi:hypothetical protein